MQTANEAGPAPDTVELMETLSHGWTLKGLWLTSIVELATVVGCREQGDQLSLRKELVTILNNLVDIRVKIDFLKIRNLFSYLVSSAYQVEVVFVKELGNHLQENQVVRGNSKSFQTSHLRSKCEWNASVIFTPSHCVLKVAKLWPCRTCTYVF